MARRITIDEREYQFQDDVFLLVGQDPSGNPVPLSLGAGGGVVSEPSTSTTAATLTQGVKTVAASGTPERLVASSTLVESVELSGLKARDTANTGNVFLGATSGNDTQSLIIRPGESIELKAPTGKKIDLYLLYVDVATNGDGVAYSALN